MSDFHPRPDGFHPKVGIAIPAYNVGRYIEQCLTTIAAQTYDRVHAYVVDDVSEDETYTWLRDRPSLTAALVRNDVHLGWPKSLNRAAWHAFADGCEAVFVMSADDWLRLDCIEKLVQRLPGHGFAVTYTQQVGEENVVQASKEGQTFDDFATWPPIANEALVWRHVWEAVGGYPEDMLLEGLPNGFMEDWGFWCEVMKTEWAHYAVLREPTYYVRMHPYQLHKQAGDTARDRQSRVAETRRMMHRRYPRLAAV